MDEIEVGDYVKYSAPFHDGIAMVLEIGSGYIVEVRQDLAHVQNGDRHIVCKLSDCEMRAKQMRLEL